jgi:hypothetical protein
MVLFGMLASAGIVTGSGPKDPNLRREWLTTHQPYSIRLGETWYSFNRMDAPIGMIVGMAADVAASFGEIDSDEREDVASVLALALGRNLTSKTYLKGVAEALNAIADPERYGARPARNYAAAAVPFSSLVATVERTADPTLREARTLLDHVMSRIPGLSETLPPRRNLFGEPIVLEGGLGWDLVSPIYTKSAKDDRVSEEIVRLKLSVDMPPKQLERIELNATEHDRLVELAGREVQLGGLALKERLEAVMSSRTYQRMNDQGRALLVRKWIQDYRDVAEQRLLREFPDLDAAVRAARRERHRLIDRPQQAQAPTAPRQLLESLGLTLTP